MPKLWTTTIETHRRAVRDAVLDTAAALVARHGIRAVTMSEIAAEAGVGRATLYKYFPDVEAILRAWHERHVAGHLARLAEVGEQPGTPGERLAAVLETYADIRHGSGRHGELADLLHRGEHVAGAERRLHEIVRALIAEGAEAGELRNDVAPDELARFCVHALSAAGTLRSRPAVRRLVEVTLDGLSPREAARTRRVPRAPLRH
ncbi:MAG: TetR/AcrR family transcriptional regulator [Thermoleophilia bacterium]|nr:TetR/AcrR family transcriptional regulator [Thermoleophilia bacterium]